MSRFLGPEKLFISFEEKGKREEAGRTKRKGNRNNKSLALQGQREKRKQPRNRADEKNRPSATE
jgi:hypothetical protein